MHFTCYPEAHARRLMAILQERDWREAIDGGAVDQARRALLTPPRTSSVFALPAAQLKALNEPTVRAMIAAGEHDEERLLGVLGAWPARWPPEVPARLSFVGLTLSLNCDMRPRCIYCNQQPVPELMTLNDWRAVLSGLAPQEGERPYVYITGGEPLLLGEDLWGGQGLLRTANAAGAACNVNTNALALNPRAALGLVSAGLGRVHISLNTHRPEVQDALFRHAGRWAQVLRGICNIQIAKALLEVAHPVIHINCVLTRLNADDFPEFLRFLLGLKPHAAEGTSSDLDVHLIPVGGEQNRALRLTAQGYVRFFTETWQAADAVWREYLAEQEIPAEQRGPLHEKVPFMSPFHRVEQHGNLREWADAAARGLAASLSLTARCYVAPTQSFILPDGAQYWCGGHATSRPRPLGNVRAASIQENLRRALGEVACLPGPACQACAGATQAINRSVENTLRQAIREWLSPQEAVAPTVEPDERQFE